MKMSKIILETKRLRLERIGFEHKTALYELLANPKVHQFFPKVLDRNEAREFFEKIQDRDRTDGHSFWAVILKSDLSFIGICGLLSQTIDGNKEIEVGYRLSDKYWNHGYGTEAASGCIQYASDTLSVTSIISLIQSVNKPSIRVAEKNGLTFEKETMFQGLPHLVYRLYLN